jgi:hypothetical protein
MKILQNDITGTQTKISLNFGGKLEFHHVFPFSGALPMLLHIFSLLVPCTTTIITLKPCALNAKFQHFTSRDLIKFPYFADTTERGDRG